MPITLPSASRMAALGLLVLASACGDPEEEGAAPGSLESALGGSTFSNTSPLCPATSNWGAWSQTSLTTWSSDVRPVVSWIIGRTGISSSTYSGHSPSIGRAADWRPHSREEGTQLANWFLANTGSGGTPLGIDYIIWQAQIYLRSTGVKAMSDRGSFTQNHCDHIHISFVASGSVHFDPDSTTAWGKASAPDLGTAKDARPEPPVRSDAGAPVVVEDPDAQPIPPDPRSAEMGVAPPPSLTPSSTESVLEGGCSLGGGADGAAAGVVSALLLCLGALLGGRRRSKGCGRSSRRPAPEG